MSSAKRSALDSFIDRQKQLNEQLCSVEKSLNKHTNHKDSNVPKLEELAGNSQIRNKIRGFRGRQSLFKRPEIPAPRTNFRAIPDYRRNPSKWTCYTLDDVSDMSNEANSQAAFSFLKELRHRKQQESKKQIRIKDKLKMHREAMDLDEECGTSKESDMDLEESSDREKSVSFRKPQIKEKSPTKDAKLEFRNNKIIMPEYDFGTKKMDKKKKVEKKKLNKIDKTKELKLDHLLNYDDGEE